MDDNELKDMIEEAASCDYIISHEIEKFTIAELDKLTELAAIQTVKVELHAEHSNFAQGTLVSLFKWPLPWEPDFDNMPVKPLTLEELKEMKIRNWLWVEVLEPFDFPNKVSAYYQRHEFGTEEYAMKETFFCGYPGITFGFDYCDYGRTWRAYLIKPKETAQ